MSNSRKAFIAAACGFLCALVVLLLLPARPNSQPAYNGRTLAEWLDRALMGAVPQSTTQEARDAVNAIGTNALPTLLTWLRYQHGPARRSAIWLLEILPLGRQRAHALWLRLHGENELILPLLANAGFAILRTNAQPAIPELVRLAKDEGNKTVASRAAMALGCIGPLTLPELTNLLSDTHCPVRAVVVVQIAQFRTNSPSVRPLILQLTSHPSEDVSSAAAGMAGSMGIPHDLAVPALVKALASPYPETRRAAAFSLTQYATQAVQAVPALRPLLLDSNYLTRLSATNALLKIAPEVLTNLTPQ